MRDLANRGTPTTPQAARCLSLKRAERHSGGSPPTRSGFAICCGDLEKVETGELIDQGQVT